MQFQSETGWLRVTVGVSICHTPVGSSSRHQGPKYLPPPPSHPARSRVAGPAWNLPAPPSLCPLSPLSVPLIPLSATLITLTQTDQHLPSLFIDTAGPLNLSAHFAPYLTSHQNKISQLRSKPDPASQPCRGAQRNSCRASGGKQVKPWSCCRFTAADAAPIICRSVGRS